MSDIANRDGNYVPGIQGASNIDGTTPTNVWVNPTTHGLVVSGEVSLDEYGLNDEATSGDITYLGKEAAEDEWLIVKIDSSSGTSFRYASEVNNSGTTTYSSAWSNRTTLTYERYPEAF